MIIVDRDGAVQTWVDTIEDLEIGSKRLDIDTFEVAQGLESELYLVESKVYLALSETQKVKLEKCAAIIIYNFDNDKLDNLSENIVGVIDKNQNIEIIKRQIRNIASFIKSNHTLKSQLISLNLEMGDLLEGVETQLLRIKHSYEKLAPKRFEEFPGFKLYSKYAAGDNMGGEFFDLFAKENKIFIMISSTSSYLASSSILQLFTELKAKPEISLDDEEAFIKQVKSEIESLSKSKKKKVSAQLMTCVLNMNTMKLRGHIFGNFKILSSNTEHNYESSSSIEMDIDQGEFYRDIQRGERFMLCSPGFIMNWQSMNPKFMIEELITDKKIKVLDILDEVYYQLKKESEGGFLKSDASSIILEVQDNVMLEI